MSKRRILGPVPDTQSPSSDGSIPSPSKPNRFAVPVRLTPFSNQSRTSANDKQEVAAGQSLSTTELAADRPEYIWLDASKIEQNKYPPRQIYDDANLARLAEDLKENGQRDAIHVIPKPDSEGRFIVCDGWSRILATRSYHVNNGLIFAKIHYDLSEKEGSWLGWRQNEGRTQHCDFDRAMYFTRWNQQGVSWDELAARTGISKSTMSNYASFAKLDKDILVFANLFPERFSHNVSALLSRSQSAIGVDVTAAIARRYFEGDYPIKWLRETIEQAVARSDSAAKKSRSGSKSLVYQLRLGNGYFRRRFDGTIEMQVNADERAEELATRIEALLKQYLDSSDEQASSQS